MKRAKKFLALLLALLMTFTMIPTMAFAGEESEAEVEAVVEETTEAPAAEVESEESAEPAEEEEAAEALKEETEPVENTEPVEEETVTLTAPQLNGAPDGAVALVTKDADGSAVVAEIEGNLGEGYYSSLKAAFAACPKDGTACTVTLVDSFMQPANTASVAKGQTITFDLAGQEIYSNYTKGGNSTVIANSGNLTIMDSADESDDGLANGSAGAIYAKSTNPDVSEIPSYGNYVITNSNVLTIRSGHIKNNTTKLEGDGAATYAIDNYTQYNKDTTTVLNINGGWVEGSMGTVIRFASFGDGDFAFNMTDGKVYSNGGGVIIQHQGQETNNPLGFTANISGGVLDGGSYYAFYDYKQPGQNRPFGETVYNITGGLVNGSLYTYALENDLGDPFNITGGYFTKNVGSHCGLAKDGTQLGCIAANDTTYNGYKDGEPYADSSINVSGYKFKVGVPDPNSKEAEIVDTDGETVLQQYATLDEALSAVKTGQTVRLLKNATASEKHYFGYTGYTVAQDFTVDLNGYIMTVTNYLYFWGTTAAPFKGLTFKDGTLNINQSYGIYGYSNMSADCALTLEDVIVNTTAVGAIDFENPAALILKNATINASGTSTQQIQMNAGGTVTAVDGTKNKIYSSVANGMGICVWGNTTPDPLTINGTGELEITASQHGIRTNNYAGTSAIGLTITNPNLTVNAKYAIYSGYNHTDGYWYCSGGFDIQGGTYNGYCFFYYPNGNSKISGGTFNEEIDCQYSYGPVEISGGEFNKYYYEDICYEPTTIKGGTFNYGVQLDCPSGVTIDNGLFDCDVLIGYYNNHNQETVTINNGTFNGGVYVGKSGLKNYGDVIINNGTFDGGLSVYSGAVQYDDDETIYYGSTTIKDGTFNEDVKLIACYEEFLSVTGGKFGGADGVSAEYNDGYDSGMAKVISGGIFANESYGADWAYAPAGGYKSAWTSCIDPAYAKAANTDDNTKIAYPFTVKPLEIKVNPETIENATKKDIEGNNLPEAAEEKVEEALENTLNNTAVGLFVETGIEEATNTKTVQNVDETGFNISMVLDAVKEAAKHPEKNLAQTGETAVDSTAAASGNGQITISDEQITDAMIDKKVNVDLEASKIEVTMEADQETVSTTTVNGATFDVKPTATITITDGTTGEVISTVTAVIPNEAITAPITFRLPVDPQIGASLKITSVWHCDEKDGKPVDSDGNETTDYKQDYLGIFPIQCENGEYFIELSANEFSYYTYENMMNITESHRVAIRDTNGSYTGFETLAAAIAAFNGTEEGKVENAEAIILLDDITAGTVYVAHQEAHDDVPEVSEVSEPASFNFDHKTIELDLNGHKFIADPATGTGVTNATGVKVINSDTDNQITLAATGVYAYDCSGFAMDGYDVKKTTVENDTVFRNTDPSVFEIEVITSTTSDRDSTNDGWIVTGVPATVYATEGEALAEAGEGGTVEKVKGVDVYADDTVTVKVVVNGARFTAADVTLTWDDTMFADTTKGRDLPQGWTKGTGDNDNTYRFTSPKGSDSYYDAGTVLGTFTFKANYLDEATIADEVKNPAKFTVKNTAHPAKVIGGWGVTLEDGTTEPVPEANLKDDTAKILLMDSMVGAVEGKTNLIYKGSVIDQELLNKAYNNNKGWSAKVAGKDVTGAQIQYCVLTAAEVANGVTPGSTGHEYGEWTTGNTVPKAKDADTYTVYYRIKADGYETVEGSREVTIAKQPVTLTWTAPDGFTGSYELFQGAYNASGFSAPTAKFSNLDGGETTLNPEEIKLTSGSAGMKDVGSYVFTAVEPKNYSFTNPTANVKVNGLDITGWQLTATNAAEATPAVGVIFRDGESYAIGSLVVATDTNLPNDPAQNNLKVVYEYFEGKYYTAANVTEGHEVGDEIWTVTTDPTASPKYSALGEYKLRMTVTADNYEKLEQEVTFTIKNPIFKYETTEYVAGYTLVLVYTNESGVTFKYDTQQMYDETVFGYRWHNTETYSKVYGIVIKGNADESKILASNVAALDLGLPTGYDNTKDASICDVNNKTTAQVDLDDMTAVQSIYNVNAGNMLDMQLVLRCDVNRDKKVDTIGDVAKVMAHYLNPTT